MHTTEIMISFEKMKFSTRKKEKRLKNMVDWNCIARNTFKALWWLVVCTLQGFSIKISVVQLLVFKLCFYVTSMVMGLNKLIIPLLNIESLSLRWQFQCWDKIIQAFSAKFKASKVSNLFMSRISQFYLLNCFECASAK